MTRENKLALVVGFALILLVGILISDHFSTARTLNAAELTQAIDPLDDPRHDNPDLIALRTERAERSPIPVPASRSTGGANIEGASRSNASPSRLIPNEPRSSESGVVAIDPVVSPIRSNETAGPGRRPGAGMRIASNAIKTPDIRTHRVESGEALSTIAGIHYGTAKLCGALAKYNGIDDPNTIRVGQSLKIPPAELLTGAPAGTSAPPAAAAVVDPLASTPRSTPPSAPRTYIVQSGDNLSKIAKKLLGSMDRWNRIYEANRDTLDTPDDLQVGMKLTIPRNS